MEEGEFRPKFGGTERGIKKKVHWRSIENADLNRIVSGDISTLIRLGENIAYGDLENEKSK